jgi:23S rRNA U2552 (ribose-2'-O)-methylase RlmE/FtsJ
MGYRSRAAFKISEIDDKFRFFGRARALSTWAARPAAGYRWPSSAG